MVSARWLPARHPPPGCRGGGRSANAVLATPSTGAIDQHHLHALGLGGGDGLAVAGGIAGKHHAGRDGAQQHGAVFKIGADERMAQARWAQTAPQPACSPRP